MTEQFRRLPVASGNYRIQEHEGCIVFVEDEAVCGQRQKMTWERKAGCWYVAFEDGRDASFSDLARQYELIAATYGGNNEWK